MIRIKKNGFWKDLRENKPLSRRTVLSDIDDGIKDGVSSLFKGVGSSGSYVGRSVGLYGKDEFYKANREGLIMDHLLSTALDNLEGSQVFSKTYQELNNLDISITTNKSVYITARVITRSLIGVALAPVGALASIGDATKSIENGKTSFDKVFSSVVFGYE
ncbi:MAG: hypothetical protein OFPII_14970 [Osedax symbiont Rs1]|nr:MAG: hypothetical protein OFPII_14970 [Osedax symbiont Rs1]